MVSMVAVFNSPLFFIMSMPCVKRTCAISCAITEASWCWVCASADQTAIDADIPTGQGESVHRIIAHDEKTVIAQAHIKPGQQPMTEIVDVAIQQWIGFDQPHGEQLLVNRCPRRVSRSILIAEFSPRLGSSDVAGHTW